MDGIVNCDTKSLIDLSNDSDDEEIISENACRDNNFLHLIEEKYFECALCTDRYKNPRSLDCLHSFCEKCLENYMRGKHQQVVCPTCRSETVFPQGGTAQLKSNFLLKSLLDEADNFKDGKLKCNNGCSEKNAIKACSDCSVYMCAECFTHHQAMKYTRENHNVFDIERLGDISMLNKFQCNRFAVCEIHKEPMKLYCRDDQCMICSVCIHSTEHKEHDICALQDKINERIEALEIEVKEAVKLKKEIRKDDEIIAEIAACLQTTRDASLNKLEKETQELRKIIEERAETLKQEIETTTNAAKSQLEDKLKKNKESTTLIRHKQKDYKTLQILPISHRLQAAEDLLTQLKENVLKINSEKPEKDDHECIKPFIPCHREHFKESALIGKLITSGDKVVQDSSSIEYDVYEVSHNEIRVWNKLTDNQGNKVIKIKKGDKEKAKLFVGKPECLDKFVLPPPVRCKYLRN